MRPRLGLPLLALALLGGGGSTACRKAAETGEKRYALTGVVAGAWLGSGMINLYNAYFRFPVLDYRLSTDVAALSVVGSLAVAALGAQSAVRRAVRIPPAEAMRSEPPARYRQY